MRSAKTLYAKRPTAPHSHDWLAQPILAAMLVTAVLLALTLCFVTALFIWRRNHFNYFKKLGIPGPEPSLIWGNLAEYHSMESYKVLGKWIEKYGNTFGFFNGDAPFIVTNDLDFIEYVFVRNFQNFVDRGFTMMTDQMHPVLGKSVMHVGGLEWKNIRSTVSCSMSAAKLKLLRKPDILQNLIDAEYANDTAERSGARNSNGFSPAKKASAHAIATSASIVFIGGFDTISTSLCYIAFTLAKYPDIQEKLRQEVLEALSTSGTLDYETVMRKMKYLGHVLDETLRLYPPGLLFVTRQAKEDFEYNGITFKAGTAFMVSQYHLQRDPQYWPNAEEFDPERFAPENEALLRKTAHVPFGIGPRNCVGRRLALLNLKYTVARMVQKYRLELGKSQMGSMEIGAYGMVSTPARGPWIKFYRV
ncbi:cytochrome P450 3A14-like isoform X3 [Dermacentor variabilis]|uniref:cytochrome P450 3A14-like isoform X3 n=1 Tax=Dermacentor variabilis TaxID=34621 RepID=UPI003F5BC8A0